MAHVRWLRWFGRRTISSRPTCQTLTNAEARLKTVRDEMVALQEELDWTVYVAFGLVSEEAAQLPPLDEIAPLCSSHRPFAIRMARSVESGESSTHWFEAMGVVPTTAVPTSSDEATARRIEARLKLIDDDAHLALLETAEFKRKWEPHDFASEVKSATRTWLADQVEQAVIRKGRPVTRDRVNAEVQADPRFLALAEILQDRRDVDIDGLVQSVLCDESVPNQPWHVYTDSGLAKRAAWEAVFALQRREDAGETGLDIPVPPEYSQGSRGKSTDFLKNEYWQLRGKLDVPKERFIAFTEVPGRSGADTLYGWAGWTPLQRVKAMLAMDEDLEDAGVPLADRVGLLDSAWRLLPDVEREDPGRGKPAEGRTAGHRGN